MIKATSIKRCASKNVVLRFNKKTGRFKSVAPNRKVAKTPHRFDLHQIKYVWTPIFLHIPSAQEQGQICIYGFMGKICHGKKFLRLKNLTRAAKKPENNRFRVPIHFATNRFTSGKITPRPPLLHPTTCCLRCHFEIKWRRLGGRHDCYQHFCAGSPAKKREDC